MFAQVSSNILRKENNPLKLTLRRICICQKGNHDESLFNISTMLYQLAYKIYKVAKNITLDAIVYLALGPGSSS